MWPWLPERVVVVHIPCVLTPVSEQSKARQSKDTPDHSLGLAARVGEVRCRSERRGGVLGAGRPCHDGHP